MFTEDISAFFSTDEFAVMATIGASTVRVIFDAAYADPLGMSGSSPVALAISSDVSTVAQGESIAIAGVGYTVVSIEPDGTGVTRLRLQEA